MSELWTMLQRGAGAGAWVVGAALVLVIALPLFGLLFAAMAKVLGAGNRNGGGM